MKTFRLRKEDVNRKWFLVDANEKIVGRLAGKIADILRGKNSPEYTPGVDGGDFVVVVNCEKVRLTGKKEVDKKYYHHTLYPGGLKETSFERMRNTHPERIIQYAVKGMLPKNKLRDRMMTRLKVYSGEDHPHLAQKPEKLTFEEA